MPGDGVTIPVHLQGRERRRAERFGAVMPVTVEGREATTQDLSTSGLSFVADRPYEIGTRVAVVIEYLLDGHQYPLRCEAEVVRSDAIEGGWQVGARLTPQSQLVEVPDGAPAADSAGAAARQPLRPVD